MNTGCDLYPIPGVNISRVADFCTTGTLTSGEYDQLFQDKTTRTWRSWVYFKNQKKIPDLCTNLYGNKLFIERIERASMALSCRNGCLGEEYFVAAMEEAVKQFANPRSDSAEALDSLGAICFKLKEIGKAITCFEYSLHMRKLVFGQEAIHHKIVQSLVYLGCAWAEYENCHRAITVFEKALDVAKALPKSDHDHEWVTHIAEIYHNLGACWERLHQHHAALDCYEKSEKLRRLSITPDVSIRRNHHSFKDEFIKINL